MPGKGYQQPTQTRPNERLLARQARHSSGRIDWDDIDIVRSFWDGIVDPRVLFDGDAERGVPMTLAAHTFEIYLKEPMFLGNMNIMTTNGTAFVGAITFQMADGTVVAPTGVVVPFSDRAYVPPPNSALPTISIQFTTAIVGAPYVLSEIEADVCECVNAVVNVGPVEVNVENTPEYPLFVQDQGQISDDEIDFVNSSISHPTVPPIGTLHSLFDKTDATYLALAGTAGSGVHIILKNALLIARIALLGGLVGVRKDVVISVIDVEGYTHVVYDGSALSAPEYVEGIDSGNFKGLPAVSGPRASPIMAKEIIVSATLDLLPEIPWDIAEMDILKVSETKSYVYNEPAEPVFVQDQQKVCNDEVAVTLIDFLGEGETLFDRDLATGVATVGTPGIIQVVLKSPLLAARLCISGGVIPDGTIITITMQDGSTPAWIVTGPLTEWDSGNFFPNLVKSLEINVPDTSDIREISLFKCFEEKPAISPPATPSNVQVLQQVTLDEIDQANTVITDLTSGTIDHLFDKDSTTEVLINGSIGSGVTVVFKFPILISRVSLLAGLVQLRKDISITVVDIEGVFHLVYDGRALATPTYVDGVDSGNFKEQPNFPIGSGGQGCPLMAKSIIISTLSDDDGVDWSISEITVLKTIETKAFVYNEPSFPVFTQDEGVITHDEIWWPSIIQMGLLSTPESVKFPFLKIPDATWMNIGNTGFVQYPFNSPKLIDRVVVQANLFAPTLIQLMGLDGVTPVFTATIPAGATGYDSGRITPVMAISFVITAGAGQAQVINIGLYKVHGVMTEATQKSPLQVEAEQQVVLDELDLAASNAQSANIGGPPTDITPTIDKDHNTSVTGDGAWVVAHVFKAPKLISRMCVTGDNMKDVSMFYTDLNDAVVVLVPETAGPVDSLDSGNFTPIMATGVAVVGTAPAEDSATINEIVTLKAIETKSTVVNAPDAPMHTQSQQVVSLDEVNQVTTTLIGDTSGDVPDLFDWDDATEVAFDGNAGSGIDLRLKAPIMLSRIVVSGGTFGISNEVVISVYDAAGVAHIVYDGTVHNLGPELVPGIDTGNFKWQPSVVFSELPASPIPTTRITIIDVNGTLQAPWTISELTLFKTIETKAFVYNEPAEPIFTQDDQHICEDEIRWSNVTITGTTSGSPRVPLRKDPTLYPPFLIQANASVYYVFNTIHLMSRVMMTGGGVGDVGNLTVQYVGIDAAAHDLPSVSGSNFGYDSGNIGPVPCVGVIITRSNAGGGPDQIEHLAIFKTFETKVANNPAQPAQIQAEQQIVRSEVASIVMSDPVNDINGDKIFDKDMTTFATLAAGAQTCTITLTHPILINRFLLTGVMSVVSMTATKPDGTTVTIFAPGTVDISKDSGNIEPIYVVVVTIVQALASVGSALTELVMQKVIEVKAFAQVQQAQLTEFYGQKVYFDPFVNKESAEPTTVNYLLLRRALEVDADNDPTNGGANDRTVVTMTSTIVDLERINAKFYVPQDDIRAVKKHVVAMATVEVGANARCTAIKYRLYKNAIATGTLTALTAQKTISFGATTFDGSTSRAVRAIMQDLVYAAIEEGSDIVLEISVWGRQVASVAVPAPITLIHNRGLGDVKMEVECVTQSPQVM